MTKGNETSCWLAKRCVFLKTGSELCDVCRESFGMFWSSRSRKHCEFCGCQIHSRCSTYYSEPGEEGRARICQRCYTYKFTYSRLLTRGEEFIAYTGKFPSASYLRLSEESCSLLLTIDPSDVEENISLSEVVNIQRGFSHAGHMKAASLYDPLRCFSITVNTAQGFKAYDLKAESLAHCEQWITLLKSALEVYRRLSDQKQAVTDYTQLGQTLPSTGHLHFPDKKNSSPLINRSTRSSKRQKKTNDDFLEIPDTRIEILEEEDMVVVETITDDRSSTSREATPTSDPGESHSHSPIVHKAHYKIRTIHTPHITSSSKTSTRHDRLTATLTSRKSTPDWRLESTTSRGLPYKGKKNPLASNCSCHAYAIESSRTFLLPLSSSGNTTSDPFKTCCELCRGKCRVVHDLSTF